MNTLYIIAIIAVAVGTWLWRGRYEHRKSEQFNEDKQAAVAKARSILAEMRNGIRAVHGDDRRSVEDVFDLNLVSLAEIGTSRSEIERLLKMSYAKWDARWTAEHLHTEEDGQMFDYYMEKMPACLEAAGMTAAELDVTDFDGLRRAARIRRAGKLASEAIGHLHTANEIVSQMDGLLSKASANADAISWLDNKDKVWIQFLRDRLTPVS